MTVPGHTLVACCCLALWAIGAKSWPTIKRCNCLFVELKQEDTRYPRRYSYETNIHHQSEYLFPTIGRIFHDYPKASPLRTIVMDFPLMPWSRELLQLVAPGVALIAAKQIQNKSHETYTAAVKACGDLDLVPRVNKSAKCEVYFHHPDTLPRIRQAVAAKCGFAIPRRCNAKDSSPLKIGILDRHTRRSITNVDELIHTVQLTYPSEVVYRKTFDWATLCQQAEWFSGVDALIMAHGQAATNSIFMPKDTLLVEVLPWTLPTYCPYKAALKDSGVRFQQVVVHHHAKHTFMGLNHGKHTQAKCRRSLECYHWYRDNVNLTIHTSDIVQAVQVAGGVQKVCS